ncbi:hypothetical protein ACP4OV_018800 [Aristida adscensionis]
MASMRFLHHLAAFFLLAHLTGAAFVPKIKNHPKPKLQPLNTYIVHANHLSKPPHFATLDHWYHSMVAAHSTPRAATAAARILYTYDAAMHGFAVRLTGDEARRLSAHPGVTGVYRDTLRHLQTTRSPGFIGLDPTNGAWNETNFGDGVIIGLIDSGIWPESPSFNDTGLGPVRASWRGGCRRDGAAADFPASLCNRKLVGAKAFTAGADAEAGRVRSGVPSARDEVGHGTHTASTAAGAEVPDTGMYMFSRGTVRGIAPKARIAMYRACNEGCVDSDIIAAVDAAVKDGVDIISISLGSFEPIPLYNDSLAIATFGAERKGIFVVLAAGNEGPEPSTVKNAAPWMTTVGAATVDRLFPANLTLGNGVVLAGQSLYKMRAKATDKLELVMSSELVDVPSPGNVMGKIVVFMTGAAAENGILLQNAGGAGLVDVQSTDWSPEGMMTSAFTVPGISLSYTAGEKLKAYMASTAKPVASFSFGCETLIGDDRAPIVSGFSSRGPNPIAPELLKPDVIAPGVNILAAWSGDAAMPPPDLDGTKLGYYIVSGTSMACPHVAGVAALIKKKYGRWTPAMIRSALMTTAGSLDNHEREILDNGAFEGRRDDTVVATPLVAGAGQVRPELALDPGLVYDAGERDYIDFLCGLNYTEAMMRLFVPDFAGCTRTLAGGLAGLNYPSFVVVFDHGNDVRTLSRAVTKVSEKAETYNVTVSAPEGVKVTVTPATLEFTEQMETKTYTVEFRSEAGGKRTAEWDFGYITWKNKEHHVRSPVAFKWNN